MKKSKIIMIASVLVIAMMSISIAPNATAKEDKKNKNKVRVAHMAYDQAIQNQGILMAMYEQIDDYILSHNWPYYTVQIVYMGSKLYIQGSYQQWESFFIEREEFMKSRHQ